MTTDEYLAHWGVLGMRWGVRKDRGPSVLSSRRRRKKEERLAKIKKEALNSPKKLYKNRKLFTDEEITAALKKFKMERELRSLSVDSIANGSKIANAIIDYGKAASEAYNVINSPMGKALAKTLTKKKK